MVRFERNQLEAAEIRPTLNRIVESTCQWLESNSLPPEGSGALDESRAAELSTIREAAEFIGRFAGPWIKHHQAHEALGGWLAFLASGDQSDAEMLWSAVGLHANHLISWGDYHAALGIIGTEGRFPAHLSPRPIRVSLITLRVGLQRLLGRYRPALEDLAILSELTAGGTSVRETLTVAKAWFKVEIEIGRLGRAAGQLMEIEQHITSLYEQSDAFERGILDADRWTMRVLYQLGVGNHGAATSALPSAIEQLTPEFKNTLAGMKALDQLRYFGYLAECRGGLDKADPAKSEATGLYLATRSTLTSHGRNASQLERALQICRRGAPREAWDILEALHLAQDDPKGTSKNLAQSPILGMRLASRRYEAALACDEPSYLAVTTKELGDAFDAWLESWKDVPLLPGGIGFLQHEERRRALHLVVDSMLASSAESETAGAAERALDLALQADACSTVASQLRAEPATTKRLVQFAGSERAVIIYLIPGSLGTHRFQLDGRGVTYRSLERREEFIRRLEPVVRELRRPPSLTAEVPAAWPPRRLEDGMAWLSDRLVPDGEYDAVYYGGLDDLGFVPVEALSIRLGASLGPPLGITKITARAPSLAALAQISERGPRAEEGRTRESDAGASSAGTMSLIVSEGRAVDPVSGKPLPHIEYSVAEYASLASSTRSKIRFRRAQDATPSAFIDAMGENSDLAVTFAHGSHSPTPPLAPGLFLRFQPASEDLSLFTSETLAEALFQESSSQGRPHPQVALIAACRAGAGPVRKGDAGASSFSGTLLAAGIPAAIVAEERIEERAAKAFIEAFAAPFLRDHKTAGESLLAARRSLAAKKATQHPHFWSPLQLHGWAGARRAR